MRFQKLNKLTLCAGATSKQAKSRSGQIRPIDPVKKNYFTDVKTTQTISYDFHQILVQRLQKWAQRRGPSLFNQRKSKYLQQFWFTRSTKGLSSRQRIFIKFSSQVPLFNGHAALQGPSPDSKHKDLIFTFFCNRGNSMSFGSKLANSPQTGIQAKESKIKLKNHR